MSRFCLTNLFVIGFGFGMLPQTQAADLDAAASQEIQAATEAFSATADFVLNGKGLTPAVSWSVVPTSEETESELLVVFTSNGITHLMLGILDNDSKEQTLGVHIMGTEEEWGLVRLVEGVVTDSIDFGVSEDELLWQTTAMETGEAEVVRRLNWEETELANGGGNTPSPIQCFGFQNENDCPRIICVCRNGTGHIYVCSDTGWMCQVVPNTP